MNQRIRICSFGLLLLLSLTIGRSSAQSNASPEGQPAWPALPANFAPPYRINFADLAKIKAGDEMLLPLQLGLRKIHVSAALKDDVIGVRNMKETVRDAENKNIQITVKSLHAHDSQNSWASLVWHEMNVQPDGGVAMNLIGAYAAGKIVGYRYNLEALKALLPRQKIAILDSTGWRVITVDAPLQGDLLGVADFKAVTKKPDQEKVNEVIADLRLIDARDGWAGLAWNNRVNR